MKNNILVLAIGVLALVLLIPEQALGRRSGSSRSSRGSSRRSSSSRSWGRRSSSSSRSSTTQRSSSSWGSRRSTTTVARPRSATSADQTAHRKAVQSNAFGKNQTFNSEKEARQAAIADFRKKHGKKYTSQYDTKPETRPKHIPRTTTAQGKQVNVVYHVHQGVGGYYYRDPYGDWALYDMTRDAHYRDRYMYRHGYDYSGRRYVHHHHSTPLTWAFIIFSVVVVLILVVVGIFVYYHVSQAS